MNQPTPPRGWTLTAFNFLGETTDAYAPRTNVFELTRSVRSADGQSERVEVMGVAVVDEGMGYKLLKEFVPYSGIDQSGRLQRHPVDPRFRTASEGIDHCLSMARIRTMTNEELVDLLS